jgi:hypothetical protein
MQYVFDIFYMMSEVMKQNKKKGKNRFFRQPHFIVHSREAILLHMR